MSYFHFSYNHFIQFVAYVYSGTRFNYFSKDGKNDTSKLDDDIFNDFVKKQQDSQFYSYLENSANPSYCNEFSNVFSWDKRKKIFEHDLSSKDTLTKKVRKPSQQVNEIPSSFQRNEDHSNKMPRMIDSYRLGLDCRSSIQKIGCHYNIEKYCLNLNPYSSK